MIHARRWFAAGMTGALFTLVMALGAGPVAAVSPGGQPLVQPYPGQDQQSPIQVVSSPGYVQTGTQANPINGQVINGQTVVTTNGGYVYPGYPGYPGGVAYGPGGVVYGPGGVVYGPGGVAYGPGGVAYGPGVCYGGNCGYTAAGPIVGYDANGSALVYDVRAGTVDPYTTDKNGRICPATSSGACEAGYGG